MKYGLNHPILNKLEKPIIIYKPTISVDLKENHYKVEIKDNRSFKDKVQCSDLIDDEKHEFYGLLGYYYFGEYVQYFIEQSNGIIDSLSIDTIQISLESIFPELIGSGKIDIFGINQFTVNYKEFSKTYCTVMEDGDVDAPLGKNSLATRKNAYRKIVAGSLRRNLDHFINDISQYRE